MLNKATVCIWTLSNNNNYVKRAPTLHTAATNINRCIKTRSGGDPRSKCLKFLSLKVTVCLVQGKVAAIFFSEYYGSSFHESSCKHPFLNGYYIYFRRAVATIHCAYANVFDRYFYFRRTVISKECLQSYTLSGTVMSLFQKAALRVVYFF